VEQRLLIETARKGLPYREMTGAARSLVYRLAIASGLRYSALENLTTRSFDLGYQPTVTILAGYSKNGQTAALPVPPDLATDLRPHLEDLEPGMPAFPLPPGEGAEMLRWDFQAARIPYRDPGGLVYDFHALGCQLATNADAAGSAPGSFRGSCGTAPWS
jgi:hypothetical protein